jgi:hypothetical protein
MKRASFIAAAALCFAACLDHELPPEDIDAPTSFIALQRDFAAFESWSSYELGTSPLAGHPPGVRVAFLNRTPAPGAESFPVGTMIVKTAQSGGFEDWLVHGMVKRGGAYNARGARGWEWFELKLSRERIPVIVWRGELPPNGERYGCLTGSCEDAPDCNACHADAIGNDFVKSPMLELRNF